jgi:CheY-like chemotaxis protein
MTVLHLEDSSADAILVRRQLIRDLPGVQVRWVETEAEYKRALANEEIHVVLSDFSMPNYDGIAALDYARTNYPLIPVIILSSSEDPMTIRAALRSGATDYVFKVELAQLARAVLRASGLRNGNGHRLDGMESRARAFELSAELLRVTNFLEALHKVLEASVALLKADKGNVLLIEEEQKQMRLAISIGFPQEFIDKYGTLSSESATACGKAYQRRERVVVEDITRDPDFVRMGYRKDNFGFTSVQSTPLRGRNGRLFAILSTHYEQARRPSEEDLVTLDLYIQEAERVFSLLESP